MKNLITVVSFFTALNLVAAPVAEYSGTPKFISASGKKVAVYPEAKTKIAGEPEVALKLSGAGIRVKSFLFIPANVYVASSYVADPKVFEGKAPIEGIKASPVRILKLTMLRSLTGADVRKSFEEALKYNDVDVNSTAIANVFAQFTDDANPGDTYTLVAYPKGSLERLTVEMPTKLVNEEGKDLGVDFFKVWFGKPIDDGIADLQKELIGKK